MDPVQRPDAEVPQPSAEAKERRHFQSILHAGEPRPPVDGEDELPSDLQPEAAEPAIERGKDLAQQELQKELLDSLSRLPVSTRVNVYWAREKQWYSGTVIKSWIVQRRKKGAQNTHHVVVVYDEPSQHRTDADDAGIEHCVEQSEIQVINNSPQASGPDERTRRRLERLRRQLGDDLTQ